MKKHIFILISSLVWISTACTKDTSTISLAGQWSVALDSTDVGVREQWAQHDFTETISLPGTTDDAELGIRNEMEPSIEKPQILHLTRRYSYVGPAWYSKEVNIPSAWENKEIELKLERVIWNTSVWIDGAKVEQEQESLIAPHKFDLTKQLSPGKHKITVRVDNSKRYDISWNNMGHAYTNDTQIMWNGILGEISLTAKETAYINEVQVFPNVGKRNVSIKAQIKNSKNADKAKLTVRLINNQSKDEVYKSTEDIALSGSDVPIELTCDIGDNMQLWNEFNPILYELDLTLETAGESASKKVKFGMRELKKDKTKMLLNDNPIFLRGTLECNIFPLTGHPPMEKEGWEKVFVTAREWGLNHLRFHSWCPPKAAFEMADSLGFYLQVELPLWSMTVGVNADTNKFLHAEADRILSEYGNHPSFCFFSLGNELQPDFDFMAKLLNYVKNQDSRHLYTTTSYTFEPGHGIWPEVQDDFFITQRTKKGWVRGQGVFDSESPTFNKDYSESIIDMPVPLVTHEIGQYAVYPNLKEIKKYTGVLDPLNFKGVEKDLEAKGLLHKADDYLMASGKLAEILYKEEIERAMKTDGCSGIQLLDLHDFPGQGTALVGLLDAFWDNKGITESSTFRNFCSPVVPLAHFAKAVYTNDESFVAKIEIANYTAAAMKDQQVSWTLAGDGDKIVSKGILESQNFAVGLNQLSEPISCSLHDVSKAGKYTLSIALDGTAYKNSWNIWVYPSALSPDKGAILVTQDIEMARKGLEKGEKVLLVPDYKKVAGLEGKFVPVFWSPIHFPKQAGSMGVLCNPKHEAFKHFPTDGHTNWQWWSLLKQSKTIVLDDIPPVSPLVEVVDNFANNRKLANIFEVNVGNGKLIFCAIDVLSDWETRAEARQLYYSLLEYMKTEKFDPKTAIEFGDLDKLYLPN